MTDPGPKYASTGEGTTLQALHAFLHTLKALGVRRYEGMLDTDTVSVEFFPEPLAAPAPDRTPQLPKSLDPDKGEPCACGHEEPDHGEHGYCLQGCPPEKCSPTSSGASGKDAMTLG